MFALSQDMSTMTLDLSILLSFKPLIQQKHSLKKKKKKKNLCREASIEAFLLYSAAKHCEEFCQLYCQTECLLCWHLSVEAIKTVYVCVCAVSGDDGGHRKARYRQGCGRLGEGKPRETHARGFNFKQLAVSGDSIEVCNKAL